VVVVMVVPEREPKRFKDRLDLGVEFFQRRSQRLLSFGDRLAVCLLSFPEGFAVGGHGFLAGRTGPGCPGRAGGARSAG
jgi:hypothetical protein